VSLMKLKAALSSRPVIYEIVPPRVEPSKFETGVRGVEDVFRDGRIDAINIPELIDRRVEQGGVSYTPVTILPEEYALLVKEYKEPIVNVISPRMTPEEFERRLTRIYEEYKIDNVVLVGKERHEDSLPGLAVPEALALASAQKSGQRTLGGICIFSRNQKSDNSYISKTGPLDEFERVWTKANAGCDFVTSQINFDPEPAKKFLSAYDELCRSTGRGSQTVFLSLTTVPSRGIMQLLDRLDVDIPLRTRARIEGAAQMGRESAKVAADTLLEIVEFVEKEGIEVPIGLHIEQVGVNSSELSLELLDATYASIK
jgi:5,10-methylenetetrahydrofolate reductase